MPQSANSPPSRVLDPPFGGFERRLHLLVFLLICTSLIATLPEAIELTTTGRLQQDARFDSPEFFLFRLIREASLALVVVYLAYGVFVRRRIPFSVPTLRIVSIVALAALASLTYSIVVKDLAAIVPLFGLRIFQYTPLVLAGYAVARRFDRYAVIKFANLLRWFVVINLGLGIAQTLRAVGRTTIFGARPTGASAGVNAFAATLIVCALWFLVAQIAHKKLYGAFKYTFWIVVSTASTFLTGSRTAMTLAALILLAMFAARWGARPHRVALALSPVLAVGVFLAVSSPVLTGRMIEFSNLTRQQILRESVACFDTPADLLLGCGTGLYSTSVTVVFGDDAFPGQIGNVHSSYLEILGGFGVIGLLLYLYFFLSSARTGPWPEIGIFILVVGLLGLPFSLWGFFPANALLLFLWGSLLAIGSAEVRKPVAEAIPEVEPTYSEPAKTAVAGR